MATREPTQLRRGKRFQRVVFAHFHAPVDGSPTFDAAPPAFRGISGRPDVIVTEMDDLVAVYEIKATDWDRIKPKNRRRNAWRHQRQLFRYVDHVFEQLTDECGGDAGVCLGVIYPEPPKTPGRRETVELLLDEYGVPVYWFDEISGD